VIQIIVIYVCISAHQLATAVTTVTDAPLKTVTLTHNDSSLSNDVFESIDVTRSSAAVEATARTVTSSRAISLGISGHAVSAARQVNGHRTLTAVSSGESKHAVSSTDEGRGESVERSLTSDSSHNGDSCDLSSES